MAASQTLELTSPDIDVVYSLDFPDGKSHLKHRPTSVSQRWLRVTCISSALKTEQRICMPCLE